MINPFLDEIPIDDLKRAKITDYLKSQDNWFHRIEFEGGITTPGYDPSGKKLHHLCMPRNLSGLSVLDIGAYDGFFSFHAKTRGATRVVAADKYVWELPNGTALGNFRFLNETLGYDIEEVITDVPSTADSINEQFDVVLFLGVLYHSANMVDYLTNVARVTKGVCILETMVDNLTDPNASAALYDHGELNNDPTNWWGPNVKASEIMLRRVGFRHVHVMNLWDINTVDATRGMPKLAPIQSGRVVIHAYK